MIGSLPRAFFVSGISGRQGLQAEWKTTMETRGIKQLPKTITCCQPGLGGTVEKQGLNAAALLGSCRALLPLLILLVWL